MINAKLAYLLGYTKSDTAVYCRLNGFWELRRLPTHETVADLVSYLITKSDESLMLTIYGDDPYPVVAVEIRDEGVCLILDLEDNAPGPDDEADD